MEAREFIHVSFTAKRETGYEKNLFGSEKDTNFRRLTENLIANLTKHRQPLSIIGSQITDKERIEQVKELKEYALHHPKDPMARKVAVILDNHLKENRVLSAAGPKASKGEVRTVSVDGIARKIKNTADKAKNGGPAEEAPLQGGKKDFRIPGQMVEYLKNLQDRAGDAKSSMKNSPEFNRFYSSLRQLNLLAKQINEGEHVANAEEKFKEAIGRVKGLAQEYEDYKRPERTRKYKKDGVAVSIDKWDSNDRTKARLMREVLSGNNKFLGKIKSIKSRDGREKNL